MKTHQVKIGTKTRTVKFLKNNTLKGYQKHDICMLKEKNSRLTHQELAKKYNVNHKTISRILKNKDYWINIDLNSNEAKSRRIRSPKFPLLEKSLMMWVDNALKAHVTITGFVLIYQAQEFAKLLDITNFKASEGWLSNFKKRVGLKKFSHSGEGNSAPLEEIPRFQVELQNLLQNWSIENIFNCDETALYWKMEPSKSLAKEAVVGKKKR
jgi:hypothetical protein